MTFRGITFTNDKMTITTCCSLYTLHYNFAVYKCDQEYITMCTSQFTYFFLSAVSIKWFTE